MNAVAQTRREEELKRVKPTSLQMSEHAFARYSVVLPVGWTLEEVLTPEVWAHVAHKFEKTKLTNEPDRSGAIIEIRTEDHAFYAELYVRAVRKMALDVDVIQFKAIGPKDEKPVSGDYKPRWNVGAGGYDIIRHADGAIVGRASDFKLKEDALNYIRDVLKG